MNSPYMGDFRVTQAFKGAQHDGLDLVGLDSKEIHATATGEVVFANWAVCCYQVRTVLLPLWALISDTCQSRSECQVYRCNRYRG